MPGQFEIANEYKVPIEQVDIQNIYGPGDYGYCYSKVMVHDSAGRLHSEIGPAVRYWNVHDALWVGEDDNVQRDRFLPIIDGTDDTTGIAIPRREWWLHGIKVATYQAGWEEFIEFCTLSKDDQLIVKLAFG